MVVSMPGAQQWARQKLLKRRIQPNLRIGSREQRGSQIVSVLPVCGPQSGGDSVNIEWESHHDGWKMWLSVDIYIKGSSGYLSKGSWRGQKTLGNQSLEDQALQPGSVSCCSWCLCHAPRDLHQGRLEGPAHQVKWRARISLWIVKWLNSSKGGLCERTRTSDLS